MESTGARKSSSKSKNWWPGRKREDEIRMYPEKLDEYWMNEFVGDKRIFLKKPRDWKAEPVIGMDKIRAKSDMGKYFVDFASSSSIHGLNHLTAPHRHPVERVLAVIFIVGALICLILLSLEFWDRYQNNAVISVLDNDYRGFSITQPALLLCPVLKYNEKKFPAVFQRHGVEDTEEARAFFAFLANASYGDYDNTPLYNAVPSKKWLSILWDLKRDVVTDDPDQDSRTWIVTDKSFCLLFFSYVGVYSSYEYWMENNWTVVPTSTELPSYTYKQRDATKSLGILTDSMSPFYPTETPDPENVGIFVGQRHHMTIEISLNEIKTSPDVKALSIKQRKCRNLNEGELKTWPVYNQFMCTQECRFELMRELCGCYPHYARPVPGVPICNAEQLRCIGENRREIANVYITLGKRCRCLASCDTATYDAHVVSDAELKPGAPVDAIINYHIDFPVQMIRRELLFGFTDFLTAVGGAAGLFLGASVISFVEIFYYATLRLFWYRTEIRKKKKNHLKMKKIVVQRNNNVVKF